VVLEYRVPVKMTRPAKATLKRQPAPERIAAAR